MRKYIIRRLLLAIPTLLIVSIFVFLIMRMIPGNIVDIMVGQMDYASKGDKASLEKALGLNEPLAVQFGRWLFGVLRGDLGKSLWSKLPVIDQILARLPVTLELGFISLIISQLIALPIGIYSALRQDTLGDYIARSFGILCIAIPGFWLGTMLVVFPSIWWGYSPSLSLIPFHERPLANLVQYFLPALTLGMSSSGLTMRMMRTMMLEVLRQDYIRTGWAKGLEERVIIWRHALKNALIPVVTVIGLQLPVLIGGTVIIEDIFSLPGMGQLIIQSTQRRDYTMVSGVLLIYGVALVLINILVDITYAWFDPRVSISNSGARS
ncbi:MAG: ABC transporter permease [Rectinemataceae bacterium]|nr:ABC transporter permease [Rectinemataceae bacterium]